ncbi:HypC/HybG/HupF family hydrogenase formation chaperone [Fibrivirga algicola]|uniref:HypC/HybG/HupF family hydrogenase formation chaperone n=1 Tax=Fibrivirga algicola TaxID=2950420 RepID=A0ABX0QL32_9BACT|nr:HypC/HybG/HupF family hydrogenase formation chaperone [Fibrivirga algicola]ARK13804.1 hydrogenase assembly protein HypC [Fibrella sp. ES10-3-2-2]NID12852.1 HypC/HybG/HupF family hydrogenase formation chaperone [Fibrivirga algicola]
MCLAIPGKIKSIDYQYDGLVRMARVNFGGILKEASLDMVPNARVGDYVLVHVGVAISIVDEEEAEKTFAYLREIGDLDELTESSQIDRHTA